MVSITSREHIVDATSPTDRKKIAERLKGYIDQMVSDAPEDILKSHFLMGLEGFRSKNSPAGSSVTGIASVRPRDSKLFYGGSEGIDDIQFIASLRLFRAAESALKSASRDVLLQSLSSATDFGALARIVSGVQFSDEINDLDPYAGPVARNIEHRRVLKEMAGEMLTSGQVEQLIGVSRQAIDKRRKSGRLLALMIGSDWSYPAFQFTDGAVDPLMEDVLIAHKEDDPWVILDIFLAKDDGFGGRSVLDLVKQKDSASLDRYISQIEGDGFV